MISCRAPRDRPMRSAKKGMFLAKKSHPRSACIVSADARSAAPFASSLCWPSSCDDVLGLLRYRPINLGLPSFRSSESMCSLRRWTIYFANKSILNRRYYYNPLRLIKIYIVNIYNINFNNYFIYKGKATFLLVISRYFSSIYYGYLV